MARPTKLTPEIQLLAEQYVLDGLAHSKRLPQVDDLALTLHVHRDTLYEWANKNKEFSDTLMDLMQAQKVKLAQLGLEGRYNPTIAKMLLSANHGVIEKTAQDLTTNGKDLAPALVKFVGDDSTSSRNPG
jgi:hypothetical protein